MSSFCSKAERDCTVNGLDESNIYHLNGQTLVIRWQATSTHTCLYGLLTLILHAPTVTYSQITRIHVHIQMWDVAEVFSRILWICTFFLATQSQYEYHACMESTVNTHMNTQIYRTLNQKSRIKEKVEWKYLLFGNNMGKEVKRWNKTFPRPLSLWKVGNGLVWWWLERGSGGESESCLPTIYNSILCAWSK